MTEPGIVVQTLQDLGITRIEAEVYLATLQESHGGPVSGYRVAQSVGKDPANLSKTLASLEMLGAVRTIQEKPRLYVPVAPADFTNKLIADMKNNRQQVLQQMADLETSSELSIPMALNNREQALEKSFELMSRCRRELLLFADNQTLKLMGTNLEVLAISSDVSVRLLSVEEFSMPGIEENIIGTPVGFADPQPIPWLQMIVDRQSWLTASFASAGVDKLPCGWWSNDPALALVFGAGLAAAVDGAARSVQPVLTKPVLEDEPDEKVIKDSESDEPATAAPAESPLQPDVSEEDDSHDGLEFIIRHDDCDQD